MAKLKTEAEARMKAIVVNLCVGGRGRGLVNVIQLWM